MTIRYDMPVMFGPSLLPDQSPVSNVMVAAINFETDRAAAAALLPRFFTVADVPTVTLTYIHYPSLEYLGGRGYQELVVAIAAQYGEGTQRIAAGFAPVMWVDQPGALISGREFMGFAKLLGRFEANREETGFSYRCAEYEASLVEGQLSDLAAIDEQRLGRINTSAALINSFGWKYIPSDTEQPDADYPMTNITRWHYRRAWTAEGRLTFGAPTPTDAPLSSRIVATLARLPVKRWGRAFMAEGDVVIDRLGSRRLDTPALAAAGARGAR
ncbi:MAG: acetoacetate decarboxylase family protein [Sphingomonas sp.]|nr:acetoacetate decarboxylase family protein [Sphingomonas sp.]